MSQKQLWRENDQIKGESSNSHKSWSAHLKVQARAAPRSRERQRRHTSNCLLCRKSKQLIVSGVLCINTEIHLWPQENEALSLFTCPMSSLWPSLMDTYSADFQKCPGWDSLRFSLGSFSSMSASWVKVGLSLRSYAQQAERISWEDSHESVCCSKTDAWCSCCIIPAWLLLHMQH